MTHVTTSTFRVAKPRVSWTIVQSATISIGACLLLTVLSFIILARLSLDPIELAGETIWVHP
jgi:hypothetical protein